MQRKNNSFVIIIGLIITIVGIGFISYDYLIQKKQLVFNEMIDKIYGKIEFDEIVVEEIKEEKPITNNNNNTNNKKPTTSTSINNNYYLGYLEIPEINFKRGFVDINSKDNTVSKNIQIIKPSDYPNIDKGNFIIAAHSGYGTLAYFKNLYKIDIGATANVYYKNYKYTYKLVNIFTQKKNSSMSAYRDYNKTTLTLITCTHQDNTSQSIYVFELISKKEF